MFNLEQSIAEWRKQMLAAGIKSPVLLEELESHLREEVERLARSGIHKQQAFEEALLKIGPVQELKTEFSKGSRWGDILGRELIKEKRHAIWASAFGMVVSNLLFLGFGAMVIDRLGDMLVMTSSEHRSAVAAVLLSYLFFSSGFLGRKFFPVILSRWARLAVGASFGGLIVLGMMIFLTLINCDIGRFMMAFCWAFFVPMGALGGLICGLEIAVQRKAAA